MAQITITNITKVAPSTYSVEYADNFILTDLFYEVSLDGTTWQTPIELTAFASPITISVPSWVDFYVRLSSNYTPPTPPETGFLMINNNDRFLINDTDSLKYTN